MARDMREQFIKASRLHFQAHIEKHRVNVENLMENRKVLRNKIWIGLIIN